MGCLEIYMNLKGFYWNQQKKSDFQQDRENPKRTKTLSYRIPLGFLEMYGSPEGFYWKKMKITQDFLTGDDISLKFITWLLSLTGCDVLTLVKLLKSDSACLWRLAKCRWRYSSRVCLGMDRMFSCNDTLRETPLEGTPRCVCSRFRYLGLVGTDVKNSCQAMQQQEHHQHLTQSHPSYVQK